MKSFSVKQLPSVALFAPTSELSIGRPAPWRFERGGIVADHVSGQEFFDNRFLKELEKSGFIQGLDGRR